MVGLEEIGGNISPVTKIIPNKKRYKRKEKHKKEDIDE